MALFRVTVHFEQEVEIQVEASSPRDAEAIAVERVERNEVRQDDVAASRRLWVEAADGETRVVG